MVQVTISKDVNLTQLGAELKDTTGLSPIGLRKRWDGKVGYVEVLRDDIDRATLQSAVGAHVAEPEPEPTRPDRKAEYAAASTDSGKLQVIAESLGLV